MQPQAYSNSHRCLPQPPAGPCRFVKARLSPRRCRALLRPLLAPLEDLVQRAVPEEQLAPLLEAKATRKKLLEHDRPDPPHIGQEYAQRLLMQVCGRAGQRGWGLWARVVVLGQTGAVGGFCARLAGAAVQSSWRGCWRVQQPGGPQGLPVAMRCYVLQSTC